MRAWGARRWEAADTLSALARAGLLIAALLAALPALAQTPAPSTNAQRLDALFRSLATAREEAEGNALVAEIWRIWLQSGRPEIDLLMEQAIAHMQSLNLGVALVLLDEIVAEAPEFAEGWNKRATVLYMMGEHDRSLADIAEVLVREPRHFGAIAGQGLIMMARERWREALVAFRRALAVNPFLRERHSLIPELERLVERERL